MPLFISFWVLGELMKYHNCIMYSLGKIGKVRYATYILRLRITCRALK